MNYELLQLGAIVAPECVLRIWGCETSEDGSELVTLYDLVDGRCGVSTYSPARGQSPVRVVD